MKKTLLLFLSLLAFTAIQASGIEFFKGTWEEAKSEAKSSGKVIFVDAYTAWCGPCKRMAANVFPDQKVGEFYNENFINVKLDMEKGEGKDFAREYNVRSYPTLLYIDGEGKIVKRSIGGKPVDAFIALGQSVIKLTDKSADFAQAYEEGNREPAFVHSYIKALNKAGKPSLKIANEYLDTQEDLNTPFNQQFIFDAVTEADSRIFEMMTDRKTDIIKLVGKAAYDDKISEACQATLKKAMEYESEFLVKEATSKMSQNHSDKAKIDAFSYDAFINYYLAVGDSKNAIKQSSKYLKVLGKDASKINALAKTFLAKGATQKDLISQAVKISKKAHNIEDNYDNACTYALALYSNGDYNKAKKIAEDAILKASNSGANPAAAQQLLYKINLQLKS